MILSLVLPAALSVNAAYKTVTFKSKKGHVISRRAKTGAANSYSAESIMLARNQIHLQGFYPPKGSRFELRMWITFRTAASDLDNGVKLAQDAIFTALEGHNDSAIDYLEVHRMPPSREHPVCRVELTARPPA